MVPDSKPLITGVYRIKLCEKRPVQLTRPLEKDPHCIATILTHNEKVPFGADGLCFDCDGNLYIGNFADGTVHKVAFDKEGNPVNARPAAIWAKADFMKSADGLFYDKKKKEIYVADSLANAIQIVSLSGKVKTLAQESTFDGKDGRMDQPCEALLRGRDVIISNFDMPVEGGVNTEFEVPNTISIIRRKK
jgi:sugar lactone lactonase YvrE